MPRRSVRRYLVHLRRIWRDIVFRGSVIVALAIVAVSFSGSSLHREYHQRQSTIPNEYIQDEPAKSLWERTLDDPVAILTLILDIFTGVLAIFTVGLWATTRNSLISQSRDMRRSLKLSDRTAAAAELSNDQTIKLFTAERRPWLGFDHYGPSSITLQFNKIRLSLPFNVHNHGPSPAVFVNCRAVPFDATQHDNFFNAIDYVAKRIMDVKVRQTLETTSIFPGRNESITRYLSFDFAREEIEAGSANRSFGYLIIISYWNPTINEVYCSISGYTVMFSNVKTYKQGETEVDPGTWNAHELPGAKRFF